MSLATAAPRSAPPRRVAPASRAALLVAALAPLAPLAGAPSPLAGAPSPLRAQDTLRPPAGATLGHGVSAPPVRVSIGDETLVPGDRGRASVRTRAAGYVLVLHADPAGRVRVLLPLDPVDADERVPADEDVVVRSRGGGRDAFTAGSALGEGTVLAAYSASAPFRATGRLARNGHWDPRAFPRVVPGTDAEGELLALVGDLLPRGAHFDYDVASYRVSEPLPVVAAGGAPREDDRGDDGAGGGARVYDGYAPGNVGGGYATATYFDDALYSGYFGGYLSSYYGGIFPLVVFVPSTFFYSSVAHRRGLFFGFDPFFLSLGCPPVFFTPGYPGYRGDPGYRSKPGYVAYTGPAPKGPVLYRPRGGGSGSGPTVVRPYGYKNREPSSTTTTTRGGTLYHPRGGDAGGGGGGTIESGAAEAQSAPAYAPMQWRPIERGGGGTTTSAGGSGDGRVAAPRSPSGHAWPSAQRPAPSSSSSAAPAPPPRVRGDAPVLRSPPRTRPR